MVYLNVILTILCLILLVFLVFGVILYKKYGKTMSKLSNSSPLPNFGDPKSMEESMKMVNNLMKNFIKK
jgi:preprotein translocase subunit SecG